MLTQGVDVWVNTPRRPYEASGTSGMKAALNGVPSLSVLDGWWIEGCAENVTGWAIDDAEDEDAEAASLYDKLENSDRPALRPAQRLGPHAAALHRHERHLLQHPPHARPVLQQRLLPPDARGRSHPPRQPTCSPAKPPSSPKTQSWSNAAHLRAVVRSSCPLLLLRGGTYATANRPGRRRTRLAAVNLRRESVQALPHRRGCATGRPVACWRSGQLSR